ncbi:MAG: hypothetical protein CBB92_07670 [Flammeovirgaceae bacterium TMED32]|nr:hypothetical protein [Rhodospirillaceae bacterium]OUT97982.1 MAG: hypothetical protein CBB92_07670 [Flammeovirgaceae bacterium TMED32]
MPRLRVVVAWILIGSTVLIAGTVVLIGRDRLLEITLGKVEYSPVIFSELIRSDRPNSYLLCPDSFCIAHSDRNSPIFQMPVSILKLRCSEIIEGQRRIAKLSTSSDGLQVDYVQRSAIFRFPDTITVRYVSIDAKHSALAIFSRSHYGRGDLGVNRSRIEGWLSELTAP